MDGGALDFIATDRDPELEAMETCLSLMERLEPDAQDRVMKYLAIRLGGLNSLLDGVGAKQAVLAIIEREPGLRGHEISKQSHLKDRTVRTALHRLKYSELIHQIDGTWHPTRSERSQAAQRPAQERSES